MTFLYYHFRFSHTIIKQISRLGSLFFSFSFIRRLNWFLLFCTLFLIFLYLISLVFFSRIFWCSIWINRTFIWWVIIISSKFCLFVFSFHFRVVEFFHAKISAKGHGLTFSTSFFFNSAFCICIIFHVLDLLLIFSFLSKFKIPFIKPISFHSFFPDILCSLIMNVIGFPFYIFI